MTKREQFCLLVKTLEGVPYIYGGKGRFRFDNGRQTPIPQLGFDCSGLVTHVLALSGGPDWRMTHSAQVLAEDLPVTQNPLPGDLAVYGKGPDAVSHVMILMPDGRVCGASGGDSSVLTPQDALDENACVHSKFGANYRHDFLGYRSMSAYLGE